MTDLEALNLLIATGDKVTSARLDYLQQTLGVNKLFLSEEFNQLKKGLRYLRDNSFDPATADLSEFLNESADPFVRESENYVIFNKIKKDFPSSTGTNSQVYVGSVFIPPYTFKNDTIIELTMNQSKVGAPTTTFIVRGYINQIEGVLAGGLFSSQISTSTGGAKMYRSYLLEDNIIKGRPSDNNGISDTVLASVQFSNVITINPSLGYFINLTVQCADALPIIEINWFQITIKK
jgi:hypothetical protein